MRRDEYTLFSEGRIGEMVLKNRLVRSATQGDSRAIRSGEAGALLSLYRNLAAGGAGLIISGDTHAFSTEFLTDSSAAGSDFPDDYLAAFARIAEEVHRTAPGCKFMVQLGSPGRPNGIGASDVPTPFQKGRIRPLSIGEIARAVDAYAETIAKLQETGVDGVQLHAAHSWGLLHAFLSPYTNRRSDAYGGSATNRARIIGEIVAKARERIGDFPILVKLNCTDNLEGGVDIDSFPETAREVARLGVDAIEVSGGTLDCLVRSERELGFPPVPFAEGHTRIGSPEKQSYFLEYVRRLALDIPVILVGGNRHVERLEQIVAQGYADLVGLCRPLICEPDLPNRWLEGRGRPTPACISCNACFTLMLKGILPYCVFKRDKEQYKATQEYLASWVSVSRADN